MTEDTRGAFSYEVAEQVAPTWERRRADIEQIATPVRGWMVRELAPQPGETVLELAAGVGDTGFEAATLIGERGRLISSDFSPAMLDAARRRGSALGLTNVEYRVIDAEHIDLEDHSVDAVLCRFGYMLMADAPAALAETRRVLRPGGRLSLAVWSEPVRNPFFTTIVMALVAFGQMEPPDLDGPGLFALADQDRVSTLLRRAGFSDVRTEEVKGRFVVPGIEEYVQMMADTAGPIALALQALPEAERQAVTAHSGSALEPFQVGDGYEIPCVALCAIAS